MTQSPRLLAVTTDQLMRLPHPLIIRPLENNHNWTKPGPRLRALVRIPSNRHPHVPPDRSPNLDVS
jgi:hypothetical protein